MLQARLPAATSPVQPSNSPLNPLLTLQDGLEAPPEEEQAWSPTGGDLDVALEPAEDEIVDYTVAGIFRPPGKVRTATASIQCSTAAPPARRRSAQAVPAGGHVMSHSDHAL